MKKRIRLVTILKNILLLTCLFFVFSASECDTSSYVYGGCTVKIKSPVSGTIFSETDNISFSVFLENTSYDKSSGGYYHNELGGVMWTSNIDGIIATEGYESVKAATNHSFFTNTLTPGIHTITCWALDQNIEKVCSDEISIEITEVNELDLPNCRIKIFVEGHYESTGYLGNYSSTQTTWWGTASGTWNDTVFTAIIDERPTSVTRKTGKIEIKINSQQDEVKSFYGERTVTCDTSDWIANWKCESSGPLPLTIDYRGSGDNFVAFSVDGEDVLSVLQTFTYRQSVGAASDSLVTYSVHDDSRVAVEFDDYDD